MSITDLAGSGYRSRIPCPFHGSRDDDLEIRERTNTWKCWGKCNTGGDIFTWMQLQHPELSFPQIVRQLAAMANIPLKPPKERIDILSRVMAVYRDNLAENPVAQKWLLDRGIREETWFKANIGFAQGLPPGVSLGDLRKVRLLNGDLPFFESRVVFAVHTRQGEIMHLQGRTLGLDSLAERKYLQLPKDSLDGVFPINHYLYGEEQLIGEGIIERAFLCEGVPDSLIARQYDEMAFAVFGKANFHTHAPKLTRVKTLYVILDNDAASQATALSELQKLQVKAPGTDVRYVLIPRPAGMDKLDVNDWYLLNGKPDAEVFLNLVQTHSRSVVEVVIDRWSKTPGMHPVVVETILQQPDPDRWLYQFAKVSGEPLSAIQYLARIYERTSSEKHPPLAQPA